MSSAHAGRPTHWPAVAAAVGGGIACAINVGKVPPTLPLLREQFALTLVQAGWVSAMLNTFAVAASLAIGFLAARLGAFPMAIGGLLIGAAASLAGTAAAGYDGLIWTRFVEGAGFMAVAVAGPGLVSAAAGDADRRFALGLWSAYMPAGIALALALSPLLLPAAGWRGMWLLSAAGLAAAAMLLWRQRRRYAAAIGGTHASQLEPSLAVLRQWAPWWLAIAMGAWALQHFALIIWLPTFLTEQRHLAPGPVALLTCAMLAVNVPGNIIGGTLLQRGAARGALIAFANCVSGLCALGIFVDAWPDALRFGLCVLLSFVGGLIPASVLSSSATLARTPQQIGVLQGLLMQGSQLGQFAGAPLIAAVVAAAGQWSAARFVMASAAALSVALGLLVWRAER